MGSLCNYTEADAGIGHGGHRLDAISGLKEDCAG